MNRAPTRQKWRWLAEDALALVGLVACLAAGVLAGVGAGLSTIVD